MRGASIAHGTGQNLYRDAIYRLLRAIPGIHRKHGSGRAGDLLVHGNTADNELLKLLRMIGFKDAEGFKLSHPYSHFHSVFMPVAELEKVVWNVPAAAAAGPHDGQQHAGPV
jgi:hypothetical protein